MFPGHPYTLSFWFTEQGSTAWSYFKWFIFSYMNKSRMQGSQSCNFIAPHLNYFHLHGPLLLSMSIKYSKVVRFRDFYAHNLIENTQIAHIVFTYIKLQLQLNVIFYYLQPNVFFHVYETYLMTKYFNTTILVIQRRKIYCCGKILEHILISLRLNGACCNEVYVHSASWTLKFVIKSIQNYNQDEDVY